MRPVQADSYSHFLSSDTILLPFFLILLDKQHSSITKFRYCAVKTLSSGIKSSRLLAYPISLFVWLSTLTYTLAVICYQRFMAGGDPYLFSNFLWNLNTTLPKLSSSKNTGLNSGRRGHAQGLIELCLLKSCITRTLADLSKTTPCPAEKKKKAFIPI